MTDSPKAERKDDRLWGGRFEREPDKAFDAFQRSFSFDRRLLPYELAVDRAWARALQKVGILTEVEVRDTIKALESIASELDGDPSFDLAHIAGRFRQAFLAGVQLLEHGHRNIDVVLFEAKYGGRVVHQDIGVQHEDSPLRLVRAPC